ncbi:MAG TPA: tetratricopeptide repeat protein [Verrucomicrobiae bacterium]|nr:tetratricopeptide repeat protein [Verrucomicrobiae bacterium]
MSNKRTLLICVLLAAITLALYWPARSFKFVDYDDNEYVTSNPNVQAGISWKGISWAFQTYHSSNWHPLTWISHMLDCQIYGLNPAGPHFTNILFHAFNAVLLFLVLLRMTGARWPSCIVAALFACHPAHVESVAWVAERKDVLSTFWGLLALLTYVSYAREPRKNKSRIYYALTFLLFALSLLSKPMLVTLPFVLLLLDFWPLERISDSGKGEESTRAKQGIGHLVMEKVPFFLLVIVSCWFTVAAQSASGAMKLNTKLSLLLRLEHALVAYLNYVKMLFWPAKLAFFYPHTGAPTMSHVLAALAVILLISFVALRALRNASYFAVGWFWFLGTLVPVIGILQVGDQAMADRYTYFPAIGLFIATVWGAAQLWEQWKSSRLILNCAAITALVACVAMTTIQLQYWRDSFTLAEHARKVTDKNYVAYALLADEAGRAGKFDEAINYARISLDYKPDYFQAHYFLGLACLETGKLDEAVEHLSEAARLRPKAVTYQKLGRALFLQGRLDEAFEQFSSAVKIDPSDSISESQMGVICARKRDFAAAVQHYESALALNPDSIGVLNNLAWIRAVNEDPHLRNGVEAVQLAKRACEATHNNEALLLGTLAAAYAEAGDFTNAVATATKARDLALGANKMSIANRTEKFLELYRSGRAYHEGAAY